MRIGFLHCMLAAALTLTAFSVAAHQCRVLGNSCLRGDYEGDCNEIKEVAHGHGEATGADKYTGTFVNGRPDGKGVYRWESGARLDGTFKAGMASGPGVYTSAKGIRYEGPFENGKLVGAKSEDCPATAGPLNC